MKIFPSESRRKASGLYRHHNLPSSSSQSTETLRNLILIMSHYELGSSCNPFLVRSHPHGSALTSTSLSQAQPYSRHRVMRSVNVFLIKFHVIINKSNQRSPQKQPRLRRSRAYHVSRPQRHETSCHDRNATGKNYGK